MRRWALRLLLAYALLIQGFAGSLTGTLHAVAAQGFDGSAELCLPSGTVPPAPHPAKHDGMCCTLGCAAQPVAAPVEAAAIAAPGQSWTALSNEIRNSEAPAAPKRRGCEARGPPRAV